MWITSLFLLCFLFVPLIGLVSLIILLSLVCILLKLDKTLLAKLIQLKRYAIYLSCASWLLNVVQDRVFLELISFSSFKYALRYSAF